MSPSLKMAAEVVTHAVEQPGVCAQHCRRGMEKKIFTWPTLGRQIRSSHMAAIRGEEKNPKNPNNQTPNQTNKTSQTKPNIPEQFLADGTIENLLEFHGLFSNVVEVTRVTRLDGERCVNFSACTS